MRALLVALVSLIAACATPAPVNAPSALPAPAARDVDSGADVLVLALSGGGARAASFSLGVLQGLRDMRGHDARPLTQHIAMVTAVSGGSVLAAHFGLHGEAGLDTFRGAYLDRDWRLNSFYAPTTWFNALRGGANGQRRLADWLDQEVYRGARLSDMRNGPRIVINATDLYNAAPFAFTPLYLDALCSDAGGVRVADAVAASMAVPMVFRPVLLEAYPERCAAGEDWMSNVLGDRATPEMLRASARAFRNYREPARQRYLHLVDGGVVDNFGVTSLTVMRTAGPVPAPLTPREAVQARRILVLVVNAERVREVDWQMRAAGPGGADVLASTLDVATDVAKRTALDAFRASLEDWERDLTLYRCGLEPRTHRELGSQNGWRCGGVSVTLEVVSLADLNAADYDALYDTPTLVTLPPATVDALIAGGRDVVTRNAAVRAMARE